MQIYREQASVHAAFLKFFEVKIAGIIKKYRYLQSFQMLWLKEKKWLPYSSLLPCVIFKGYGYDSLLESDSEENRRKTPRLFMIMQ